MSRAGRGLAVASFATWFVGMGAWLLGAQVVFRALLPLIVLFTFAAAVAGMVDTWRYHRSRRRPGD